MYLKYKYHLVEWTTSLRVTREALICSTATAEVHIPVNTRLAEYWFTHLITTYWDERRDPELIVDLEPLKPFAFEIGMKVQIPTSKSCGSKSFTESRVIAEAVRLNVPYLVVVNVEYERDEISIGVPQNIGSEIFKSNDLKLYTAL